MWIILLLITLGSVWLLAYAGAGVAIWLATLCGGIAVSLMSGGHPLAALALGLLGAAVLLLLGVPQIRQRGLSRYLLKRFRRVMPHMSATEREALQAGSVWWDTELFSGRPDWSRLLAIPPPHLSEREQAFLDGPTEQLCRMLDDWQINYRDKDLPPEAWHFIRDQGFFGLILPAEYGGLGFSAQAHSAVVMKLASHCVSAAVTVMVPNSLGPGKLLLHYGTEAQKNRYLPALARGDEIPCFALTSAEAGSDASAMPDVGVVCRGNWHGREMLGVRLNWSKRYITLGPVCTLLGLAFRLYDPDGLLHDHADKQADRGITLALVPRDTAGVQIGERHIPLDVPFQNGPNSGHDVFVPLHQLIGGEAGIGRGWQMLMECLAEGRGISLPSLSVGAAKMASRYTGAYAAIREQFNMPIGRFEGVQEALAQIAGLTWQMDATRLLTLSALDLGEKPSVLSAVVKYQLTEKYRQVINHAMDIQGGSGICMGPANLIAQAYRAIPIAITVEGANILTRSMIVFGQGAIRAHPWVLREFEAAHDPDRERGLRRFDQALFGHTAFMLRNLARSTLLGLSDGRFSPAPRGAARRHFQRLNRMSAAFALVADLSMLSLGGSLKRRERLSARLGDLLSELYLSSAALKRFHDPGSNADELPLLHWSLQQSLYRMQEQLRGLFANLPLRPLAWALQRLIFPLGMRYQPPSDRLDTTLANLLLQPGAMRDRLTSGIYQPHTLSSQPGRLEAALALAADTAPLQKTLREARRAGLLQATQTPPEDLIRRALDEGVIEADEARQLDQMAELRRRVIAVDSFCDYGTRHASDRARRKRTHLRQIPGDAFRTSTAQRPREAG